VRIKAAQLELRACADAFNLAGEQGIDSARLIAEMASAMRREREARAWQDKMQRKLSDCPGFVGGDLPSSERSKGCIIVDPAMAREARDWLKRRFYINEKLELSDQGLCIEVVPRARKAQGARRAALWLKPEQFDLGLLIGSPL